MDRKGKTEGVRRLWDKYKFVGLVALAGIALLIWPGGTASSKSECESPAVEAESVSDTERKMEEILARESEIRENLRSRVAELSRLAEGDLDRAAEMLASHK